MFSVKEPTRNVSGKVAFNRDRVTIEITHHMGIYEIDVERMINSANTLDWIFQIARKSWATPEIIHDLIHVIDGACRECFGNTAQGVFCPSGVDKTVKWPVASAEALNRNQDA